MRVHGYMVKEWFINLNFHLSLAPPFLKQWPHWRASLLGRYAPSVSSKMKSFERNTPPFEGDRG
jgi:hypothetical protein